MFKPVIFLPMKMLKHFAPIIVIAVTVLAAVTSCIEDGITTSPADQPAFSVDTLDMGTFFSGQPTPTYQFVVYNRHDKILNISSVSMRDGSSRIFRMNVDGTAGETFSDIEIRPNDSIYVFVEATLPRGNGRDVTRSINHIDFVTNGVTSSVVVAATGRDVDVHHATVIDADTRWTADVPHQIFDTLTVAQGVTLTLEAGVELFFHDKAHLNVCGRLITEGTPEAPVVMTGDRTDNVVGQIPFDVMASQWDGVTFNRGSEGSRLSHTVIKNMTSGVLVDSVDTAPDGSPSLTLLNCRVRNSAGYAFCSYFSNVRAVGTEFSDAGLTPLLLTGGVIEMSNVTVANYYLFAPAAYPLVTLNHANTSTAVEGISLPYMQAVFSNCIFYGLGSDINITDLNETQVYMRRCLFKSPGSDDERFINCLWELDPLYYTVREEYIFDYRLKPGSPAADAADVSLIPADGTVDFYGVGRPVTGASVGAYQYLAPEE